MKISELIEFLSNINEEHGNIDCYISYMDGKEKYSKDLTSLELDYSGMDSVNVGSIQLEIS